MRYYREEHEAAYRTIAREGHSQWNDLFDHDGEWTYDRFQNRDFLERTLPGLDLPEAEHTHVFEYGCGTGPAACYLAAQGYQVDAVDLIPEAIAIARRMATERGVDVTFDVADICGLTAEPATRRHDIVLDSFCLQSIVTDEDRDAVFAAVRARAKPGGYYLISTAVHTPDRDGDPDYVRDAATGIVYREVPDGAPYDYVVMIGGRPHIPHRRHLSAGALRQELETAGFEVISLEGTNSANVVCRLGPS
jgi:2-polyprenyl-3-methyl-5-hydroxy-6-metoxy-1,4-benzoquinol methylase